MAAAGRAQCSHVRAVRCLLTIRGSFHLASGCFLYGGAHADGCACLRVARLHAAAGAFKEIVRIYLQKITYDDLGIARLWKPAPYVVLDPRIQAGTPCIEGTRIPTETIASMSEVDPPELVAQDLDLTVEQVLAAGKFEAALLEGRGITV